MKRQKVQHAVWNDRELRRPKLRGQRLDQCGIKSTQMVLRSFQDAVRLRLHILGSEEKLLQLERQAFLQTANSAWWSEVPEDLRIVARDHESDHLILSDEVFNESGFRRDEFLNLSKLQRTYLLQRNVFG